jgi:predicted nucleic-acid-binding Zn-ribbon protein
MYQSKQCPKCGSGDIAGPHKIHGGEGRIKIDLPGLSTATLVALTCARCGYSEFYSDRGGLANIRRSGRFLSRTHRMHVETTRICQVCKTQVDSESQYCPECGSMVG